MINPSLIVWGVWLECWVIGVGGGCWGGHFYLYVARGFKKVPAIYGDFDFFSPKKPPILKIQVRFFST